MNAFLSLKDHVYNYISQAINEGRLKPNEKINEKLIMEDLNISRTPVREAFLELSVEGYLENVPRKGFHVKRVDEKKAQEVYELLGVLDALCATSVLQILDSNDYKTMESAIEYMDLAIQKNDFSTYYEYQNVFHNTYIDKCTNHELVRMIMNLKKIFIRQSYENIDDEHLLRSLQKTNDEHKEILKLMKSNKVPELEAYVKAVHWDPKNAYYDSFE